MLSQAGALCGEESGELLPSGLSPRVDVVARVDLKSLRVSSTMDKNLCILNVSAKRKSVI